MKEIYLLLKKRLEEIAELNEVSWYSGQDEQTGDQSLLVDKAAYLEFAPINWRMLGQQIQRATIDFEVHLVQALVEDGDGLMQSDHLDLINAIYKKLQGWEASLSYLQAGLSDLKIINCIDRLELHPQQQLSNIWRSSQRFQAEVIDYNARKDYQEVSAQLNLIVDV